jgi:FixJ family two-component response regulator
MTSSTTLLALSANVSQLMKLPSVDPGPWPESRQPLWSNVAVFKLLAKRESLRKAARRLIKSYGIAVGTFASAEDFLTSGQLDQTACLVLDVQMPGLNGLELQRLLVAGGHQIPIIFITAFTDESTRVQALEAGAIGYLIKPFEEADLLGYIHRALHRRETAPRPRPPPQ